ncbi:MAG: hypothetical protein NTU47_11850 [Ignavibacteriales bacterium]|nr:hypothetical protein [Ignavibacteriales bacterium]
MPAGNPATSNPSIVQTAQRGDPAERAKAIEHIVVAHWKPLYKYVRAQYRLSHTEAWTITLNFLKLLDEGIFFAKFDGSKTSLREFIRGRLDVFMPTPAARKVIAPPTTIDIVGAEEEFLADQTAPNQSAIEYYNNEWVRNLLTLAVEELHNKLASEGKSRDAELFMKLDLQDRSGDQRVTLEAVANELSMPLGDAWNSLAKTRQRFQNILIDLIRSFISSDAEFRREIQTFMHS